MSSINRFPTFNYSQPEEYRFSHDSVFMARQVFELVNKSDLSRTRCLDLCAGCGIIGLDFLFHCLKEQGVAPFEMDFLEVQAVYQKHFEENVRRLRQSFFDSESSDLDLKLNFFNKNYASFEANKPSEKYDLILCNPPYFFPEQGTLSHSEFKNRCRFFIDSDFKSLLLTVESVLSQKGSAYILLRNLPEHGWNSLEQAKNILSESINLEIIADIRGTDLVKLSR